MIEYKIYAYISDGTIITIPVKYEKVYDLRRDVTNMGVNGILQEVENGFKYYPPNKIDKIEIEKI